MNTSQQNTAAPMRAGDHEQTLSQPIVSERDKERLEPYLRDGGTPPGFRLRQLIERARIVSPSAIPPDVVTMNSHVCIRDPRDGSVESFMLCYPDHDEDDGFALSVLSPLGASLLAAREGEQVSYPGARGVRTVQIESLEYQPERAGDLEL